MRTSGLKDFDNQKAKSKSDEISADENDSIAAHKNDGPMQMKTSNENLSNWDE